MGEAVAGPFLPLGPGGQVDVLLGLHHPAVPGSPAVGIAEPAAHEIEVILPIAHRRDPVGEGEILRLAVAYECLRQRQALDQALDPEDGVVGIRRVAQALPHGRQELIQVPLLAQRLPFGVRLHGEVQDGLVHVSDQAGLRQLRGHGFLPECRRAAGELGGILGQERFGPALGDLPLLPHAVRQADAGGLEEAEEGWALPGHLPVHAASLELQQKLQVVLPVLIGGGHPLLGEGEVDQQAGLRVLLPGEPHLALEPKLASLLGAVVGKQPEGRRLHLLQVRGEDWEQAVELAGWIEPQANPRPLLVGEALLDLGNKCGGNHGADGKLTADCADGRGLDRRLAEEISEECS